MFWNWLKEHGPVIGIIIALFVFFDDRQRERFGVVFRDIAKVERQSREIEERLTARIDELAGRVDEQGGRIDALEERLTEEIRAVRQLIHENRNALDQRIDRVMLAIARSGTPASGDTAAAVALLTGAEVRIPLSLVVSAAADDALLQDRLVPAKFADSRLILYPAADDGRTAALLSAEGWMPVDAGDPGLGFVRLSTPN